MDYNAILDEIERLHQDLKKEYLNWAYDKSDKGIGSVNNPLTLNFINKKSNINAKNEIKKNLRIISNYESDVQTKYILIRELYLIHPSFHEMWFFSSHYNHMEIIKGRLGLKAYLTCKSDNHKTKKGITTFLLKRAVLLENLYSSKLDGTLLDFKPVNNLEGKIEEFLSNYNGESGYEEVLKMLPDFFGIVNTLLENANYSPFNSILNYKSWINYAPCSINEGPIFYKKSNKSRIDIFKELKSLNENNIRKVLMSHFDLIEVLK